MNPSIEEVSTLNHSVYEMDTENSEREPQTVTCWGRMFTINPNSSQFTIQKQLQPIQQEIDIEINKRLACGKIIHLTLKNCLEEAKRTPLWTVFKVGVIFPLCLYGEMRLIEGIFAGEVLLKNTPFNDLFSSSANISNIDVQNNAGGSITNAVQEIQFGRDGILTLGSLYFIFLRNSYRKARGDVIDACYDQYLGDETIPKQISNALLDLKKMEHDKSWI
ncbi:MAG TPA: hypothetical protein VIH61_04520 [Waddliaceae bacterium]